MVILRMRRVILGGGNVSTIICSFVYISKMFIIKFWYFIQFDDDE
jgi:hypothetical protein